MTNNQNVEIYYSYWDLLSQKKYDEAFALLHDDFQWWVAMAEPMPGFINPQNKAQYMQYLSNPEESPFPDGIKVSVKNIWACEGDKLAAQNESFGISRNGNEYRNIYAMLVEFKDNKVICINEYTDTAYGARTVGE